MAGRAVGGAAGAGCGIFSLVGLLLGVGLTVFLASQVTTSLGGGGDGPRSTTTLPDALAPTSSGTAFGDASLTATPSQDLVDGSTVRVRGEQVPPGPVEVTACLTRGPRAADGATTCDLGTTRAATASLSADGTGTFELDYPVQRVITVAGVRYDCAAVSAGCSLVAHESGAFDTGPAARLAFAADLPAADAQPPPRP